jgi:uncharacterized membrane protein YkvA (DUF1232 family)
MDASFVIGILVGLVLLWVAIIALLWLLRPKGVPARELVRVVPDVIRLLRSIISDRAAPLDVRVILVGLFVWILSPIDLIPEFIPVLGPLDDVVVAVLALRYARRRMGIADLERRWGGSADGFALVARVVGRQ